MKIQPHPKSKLNTTWNILIIDDDEDDYLLARDMLKEAKGRKYDVRWASTYDAGREELFSTHYNAVLVDYDLGLHSGIDLIREANDQGYQSPLILFTGRGNYEVDVEAMQAGATLYLTKSEANPLLLERAIRYAIDIKQKEQALRDSEAKERAKVAEMDAILDAVPAVVWVTHDSESREATGNRAAYEFQGVPFGKNISMSAPDEAPQNVRVFSNGKELSPEEMPLQRSAVTGKPIRNYEEKVVFEDGREAYLLGNVTPLLEEDGNPCGAIAAFIDITERKQMEEALQLSEERFYKAFNANPNAQMISRQEDGRIHGINDSFERMFGYHREEVLGKTSLDLNMFAHPADRKEAIRRMRADGNLRDFELEIQTKTGEIRWASLSGEMVTIGGETLILTVIQDITERKRVEEALRDSEQRYASLFNAKTNGIAHCRVITDNQGRPIDYEIIEINEAYEQITGIKRSEIEGRRATEVFPGIETFSFDYIGNYGRIALEGGELNFETFFEVTRQWLSIYIYSPKPGEFTAIFTDISQSKMAEEEQRERRVQMEIQRRLLDYREQERQIIAREIHDGAVQDLSSLLFHIQFTKGSITELKAKDELDKIAQRIQNNVQNLREMISEMRPPSLIRFGLVRALDLHLEDFKEKNPEIELEISLIDDTDRLTEQARLNLFRIVQEALKNAVKHGQPTKITVQLTWVDHQAILEIVDNGKGFSVSSNLADYSKQSHFGLVGMKERAQAIGGSLVIISRPRHGTTIRVVIPLPNALC